MKQSSRLNGFEKRVSFRNRNLFGSPPHAVGMFIVMCDDRRRYNEPDKLAVTGGNEIVWPVPYWYIDAGAATIPRATSAEIRGGPP